MFRAGSRWNGRRRCDRLLLNRGRLIAGNNRADAKAWERLSHLDAGALPVNWRVLYRLSYSFSSHSPRFCRPPRCMRVPVVHRLPRCWPAPAFWPELQRPPPGDVAGAVPGDQGQPNVMTLCCQDPSTSASSTPGRYSEMVAANPVASLTIPGNAGRTVSIVIIPACRHLMPKRATCRAWPARRRGDQPGRIPLVLLPEKGRTWCTSRQFVVHRPRGQSGDREHRCTITAAARLAATRTWYPPASIRCRARRRWRVHG